MNPQRSDFKAGLFIIVSIVLILGILFSIRGVGRMFQPSQTRVAIFHLSDNIGGLGIGDEVRIGGYGVGQVQDIELIEAAAGDANAQPQIQVTLKIPSKYQVRENAVLRIETTFTGQSVLNFETLGTGQVLADSQPITGSPDKLSQLMASLSGSASDVRQITTDVRTTTVPRLNETIEKYKDLAILAHHQVDPEQDKSIGQTTRQMMAEVRDLLGDTKGDIRSTIASLATATGALKDKLPSILTRTDELLAKFDSAMTKADQTIDNLRITSEHAKAIGQSTRSLIVQNKSKFDALAASLKTTGDNLKAASAEIRRSPWRLLYKPAPGEMANLNLFDAARQFAEGASDLNEASAALRDATADPDAKPETITKLLENLDQSFAKFQAAEKELWKRVEKK